MRSNDDVQKKLEEAFEGMGLFYERKLNQHSDQPRSLRIDALSAGQAYLAYGLDGAANAEKSGLAKVKRVQHPNYDFNTLNELAQLKH